MRQAGHRELDLWGKAGLAPRLWLRDDDAIGVTPALERLTALCERFAAPALLAVIPVGADAALAAHVARHPLLHPSQHGFAHFNHAPAGEKKQELGPHRPLAAMLAELAEGRGRLAALFGDALRPVLVPPWNRIAPALLPHVPSLSAFGPPAHPANGRLDSNIDIIDWRGGRGGHSHAALLPLLATALAQARAAGGAPVGILTHHLAHDAQAWRLLEDVLAHASARGDCLWTSFDALVPA